MSSLRGFGLKCAGYLLGCSTGVKFKLPWSLVAFPGWSLTRGRLFNEESPSMENGRITQVVFYQGGRSYGVLLHVTCLLHNLFLVLGITE